MGLHSLGTDFCYPWSDQGSVRLRKASCVSAGLIHTNPPRAFSSCFRKTCSSSRHSNVSLHFSEVSALPHWSTTSNHLCTSSSPTDIISTRPPFRWYLTRETGNKSFPRFFWSAAKQLNNKTQNGGRQMNVLPGNSSWFFAGKAIYYRFSWPAFVRG